MRVLRHHAFTLETYFETELDSSMKFEFYDGAILAMAGGSPRHNAIGMKTTGALDRRVGSTCRAFGSDQRVVTGDGVYTYPDAMVVCGQMELTTFKGTATVHNPTLLVEVLSPSTRDYDLGEKLEHYQTIPALLDILLIETDTVNVLRVYRTSTGWETERYLLESDSIQLQSLPEPLSVREIYERAFEV